MSANNNIAFLTDENGMILTLTGMKLGGVDEVKYPPNFHIGFAQIGRRRVERDQQAIEGRRVRRARTESTARVVDVLPHRPGGFTTEVLA